MVEVEGLDCEHFEKHTQHRANDAAAVESMYYMLKFEKLLEMSMLNSER